MNSRHISYPMLMVAPAGIFYFVFYVLTIVGSFWFSFTDWSMMRQVGFTFVGLENFRMILEDKVFFISVLNTSLFVLVTTFLKIFLGVPLALLMNMNYRGRNVFRAIFFLPSLLGALTVGYVFTFIFRYDSGLINLLLRAVGLNALALDWLGDMRTALGCVIVVETWMWTGFGATMILAGLQTVPGELIDAARVDGARPLKLFRHVKLPFILPAINLLIALCIAGGFNVFDIVMALTKGGPIYATEVMYSALFKAQSKGLFAYATAIGLIQFLLVTVVVVPTVLLLRRKEIEQ